MDQLVHYRALIQEILESHTKIPYKYGDIEFEVVFDEKRDRYLLMLLGRANKRYEHGCLIHIDIIDGKIWVQRDGTEIGVANELLEVGVPKNNIVLGFKSPERRQDTECAIA